MKNEEQYSSHIQNLSGKLNLTYQMARVAIQDNIIQKPQSQTQFNFQNNSQTKENIIPNHLLKQSKTVVKNKSALFSKNLLSSGT